MTHTCKVFLFFAVSSVLASGCSKKSVQAVEDIVSIQGTYYVPLMNHDDGTFTPEALLVINATDSEQWSVHSGAVIKTDHDLKISGDKLTISSKQTDTEIYLCNFIPVRVEADSIFDNARFEKSGENLRITPDGQETFVLSKAPQEDIDRIKNLTACSKQ